MTIKIQHMILLFALSLMFSFCTSDASNSHTSPDVSKKQMPAEVVNVSHENAPMSVEEVKKREAAKTNKSIEDATSAMIPVKKEADFPQKPVRAEQNNPNNEEVKKPMVSNQTKLNEPISEEPKVIKEASNTPTAVESTEKPTLNKPNHALWNTLLQKHVSSTGKVNYKGIKAEKARLEAYIQELDTNPIETNWSRGEKMAYWINAYNAFTIKLIVDNYPVKSITDLEGGKPWDKKWIKLGGNTYSLNEMENDILRPVYKEPRIHFAVNCAANSCPPLLNRAWTAANLEKNFEQQARGFINNVEYNVISENSAVVSKIFDWYGEDFGDLRSYLNKFLTKPISESANITFKEYNWKLNE